MDNKENNVPKHREKLEALDNLSLGISMIAAVAIGFGIGYGLKELTGYGWTLWLGLFWGIAAAGLNIYRAYKRAQKQYEGMENDPRYSHRAKHGDKASDDED
ncbi:AtpZ/AtpI family protein [Poseidonibacter lekithochrous]|uniref:AtpZ/AtpI family protein n=1 Tax=Poseidonibacter lekithochrous TaxID=1904463 RepID=UPI0008FC464D|nr:AtpZ/AtpI family protein [Poseidonibacter lekithochrous]QKJ22843.1 ATPase_gene1 domain-containing protein [Poseidonibacter lekithochrous]